MLFLSGTVFFPDREKQIILSWGYKYIKTPIYEQAKKETPDWVNTATAAEIYIQMCDRIVEAPTVTHMIFSTKILIPILWKKIQEEEGKVYFRKTAAVGKTESLLNQMGEILES